MKNVLSKIKDTLGGFLNGVLPASIREDESIHSRFLRALRFFFVYSLILLATASLTAKLAIKHGEPVKVPKVEGESLLEGSSHLSAYNLTVTVESGFFPDVEKNIIVKQRPKGGEFVKKGRVVHLVVSKGYLGEVMPVLTNLSYTRSVIDLSNSLLVKDPTIEIEEPVSIYRKGVSPGVILEQKPLPGEKIAQGQRISFVVSSGFEEEEVRVTNFISNSYLDVVSYLEKFGVVVDIVAEEVEEDSLVGKVIEQSLVDRVMKQGEHITLKVGMNKAEGYTRKIERTKRFYFQVPTTEQEYNLKIVLTDNLGEQVLYEDKAATAGSKVNFSYRIHGSGEIVIYLNKKEHETIVVE